MSLLEEALTLEEKVTNRRKVNQYSAEEVELALAWLKDEVTYSTLQVVAELPSGAGAYAFLAIAVREAYRRGLINIKGK